jgi:hypothetical protein
MDPKVQFSTAPLPAHEAVLHVSILLAQAVQEILARQDLVYVFEKVRMSAIDVPRLLGYFAAMRLPAIGSATAEEGTGEIRSEAPKTIENIWDDFLREERIKRLPEKLTSFLRHHRDAGIKAAENEKLSFDYLKAANLAAYSFVKRLLKLESLDELLPASPADVDVIYDEDSRRYCAAASRTSGRVQWALQIVPHSLSALVLVERVFAHEYLSHLVPRNGALRLSVPEGWLVALLEEAYLDDMSQLHWRNLLWASYRRALEDHVANLEHAKNPAANLVRTFGSAGVEIVAAALYQRSREPFWRFTREVVTAPTNDDEAGKIESILIMFANHGPEPARKLLSSKWQNINDLYITSGSP